MDKYIGKRLDGRYEIQEILGVGGMAVVYKAYDTLNDRVVAIKILKDEWLTNDDFRRRFKNESKAIAVLSHSNIVKIYDVNLGDLIQYIVMEFVDGITLKEYIEQQQCLKWKEAVHFTLQILRALQHAHDKGIVHRDIKPQNIILLPDGTIKVTDFGIARFSRSEHRTMTDKAIGSVHYISPEQAKGDVTDDKTDIYSVGVMLYEMLTGRVPFDADTAVSVAIMQMQNEPVAPSKLNPNIPEGLEQITLRAMQKTPDSRYQSAAEMLNDIEKFRLNPALTFDYSNRYFVDNSPTKYVPGMRSSGTRVPPTVDGFNTSISLGNPAESADILMGEDIDEEDYEQNRKSPIVPILFGVTAAIVIVLIILLVVFWGRFFGSTGDTIECPKIVGMNYNEAVEQYPGFEIKQTGTEYSEEYESGVIISQNPTVGKQMKGNKEIKVVVSLGPKSFEMSSWANTKLEVVQTYLKNQGIDSTATYEYNDNIASGFVIRTDPASGDTVATGSTVIIYVSKGPAPKFVTVPNLVGLPEDQAKTKVEGEGLTLGTTIYQSSTTYPNGYVINQNLKANSSANKGSELILTVSCGLPITVNVDYGTLSVSKVQVVCDTIQVCELTKKATLTISREYFLANDISKNEVTVLLRNEEGVSIAEYKLNFKDLTATLIKSYAPVADTSSTASENKAQEQ